MKLKRFKRQLSMNKKLDEKQKLKIHHSIDSFGILKVSMSNIRVEKLEDRIKPKIAFPHRHDFFQVVLIKSGSGYHKIDFINHKVLPQQIFIMKPGQMHSWDLAKNIKGLIVEFSYQSLDLLKESSKLINILSLSPDSSLFLSKKDFTEAILIAGMMREEFAVKSDLHDLSLQAYLGAFIIHVLRKLQVELNRPKSFSVIENFKILVDSNFRKNHTVEFYARELRISPKTLTMQLSRSAGKSPRQMIQERILLEAKRYLAFSELNISEISYELGFEDANYFSRFFRQHEKKTPLAFRKDS